MLSAYVELPFVGDSLYLSVVKLRYTAHVRERDVYRMAKGLVDTSGQSQQSIMQ